MAVLKKTFGTFKEAKDAQQTYEEVLGQKIQIKNLFGTYILISEGDIPHGLSAIT